MDCIDMAKDLGLALKDSEQFMDFKRLEIEFLNTEKASLLYDEFIGLNTQLMILERNDSKDENIDLIAKQLETLKLKMEKYPVIDKYLKAKMKFQVYLNNIHSAIDHFAQAEEDSRRSCYSCKGCGKG